MFYRHEDLELVSCTDLAQKWGKEKKGLQETHTAEPFKDFCHPVTKRQKIIFKTSRESSHENFTMLSAGKYLIIITFSCVLELFFYF